MQTAGRKVQTISNFISSCTSIYSCSGNRETAKTFPEFVTARCKPNSRTPHQSLFKMPREGRLDSVGNWRSGLGLAYPHFHEDVSVSVPFVWRCLTSLTMLSALFPTPPHQTVRSVFPNMAFQSSYSTGFRSLRLTFSPTWPSGIFSLKFPNLLRGFQHIRNLHSFPSSETRWRHCPFPLTRLCCPCNTYGTAGNSDSIANLIGLRPCLISISLPSVWPSARVSSATPYKTLPCLPPLLPRKPTYWFWQISLFKQNQLKSKTIWFIPALHYVFQLSNTGGQCFPQVSVRIIFIA